MYAQTTFYFRLEITLGMKNYQPKVIVIPPLVDGGQEMANYVEL